jgi:hypothetical protein
MGGPSQPYVRGTDLMIDVPSPLREHRRLLLLDQVYQYGMLAICQGKE